MDKLGKRLLHGAVLACAAGGMVALMPVRDAMAVPSADILVVMDESLSMAGEQAWVSGMITSLDTALVNAGVTGNRYGLVGYVENTGAHGAGSAGPHKHVVGGGDFGTAAQFATAAGTLTDNGSIFEDGYEAIKFGLDNYGFRTAADVAINVILITDEDRDDTTGGAINKANLLLELQSYVPAAGAAAKVVKLNVVVNNPFFDGTGTTSSDRVLGVDSNLNWYREDGSGGFTTGTGGTVGNGAGTTESDYVNGFALDPVIRGAAWDLNRLRAGGATADSFTKAFVDVKVVEIQQQTDVPEPAALALLGVGLAGLGALRRRRAG